VVAEFAVKITDTVPRTNTLVSRPFAIYLWPDTYRLLKSYTTRIEARGIQCPPADKRREVWIDGVLVYSVETMLVFFTEQCRVSKQYVDSPNEIQQALSSAKTVDSNYYVLEGQYTESSSVYGMPVGGYNIDYELVFVLSLADLKYSVKLEADKTAGSPPLTVNFAMTLQFDRRVALSWKRAVMDVNGQQIEVNAVADQTGSSNTWTIRTRLTFNKEGTYVVKMGLVNAVAQDMEVYKLIRYKLPYTPLVETEVRI